jgi:hypothetical protein
LCWHRKSRSKNAAAFQNSQAADPGSTDGDLRSQNAPSTTAMTSANAAVMASRSIAGIQLIVTSLQRQREINKTRSKCKQNLIPQRNVKTRAYD